MRRVVSLSLIVFAILLSGCQSTYYKAMRTLGKEKRDILVQRIKDAKKDQDQTKQQLQTTMESFQALTGFQGGFAGEELQTPQLRLRKRSIAGG